MKNEKWIFKDKEIEVPIVSDEDIDFGNDINLENTMELAIDELKNDLEDTKEIELNNTKQIPIIDEEN